VTGPNTSQVGELTGPKSPPRVPSVTKRIERVSGPSTLRIRSESPGSLKGTSFDKRKHVLSQTLSLASNIEMAPKGGAVGEGEKSLHFGRSPVPLG
jgi:hypothetical protein